MNNPIICTGSSGISAAQLNPIRQRASLICTHGADRPCEGSGTCICFWGREKDRAWILNCSSISAGNVFRWLSFSRKTQRGFSNPDIFFYCCLILRKVICYGNIRHCSIAACNSQRVGQVGITVCILGIFRIRF